ncbi:MULTISPECIES: hypothetical protein [Burkholderia]|uniref:LysM domain-containing protein n=2 Tax=Burkholderia glumae TaxID=337 RepID=A0AAQ0BSW1_BURGL|nr:MULTISPECIES: hypothetical protein [Burkholderia]ACR29141.1 Putative phage protein [Burkholderia glumae BGR1]AJY64996.1 putative phage protein [Burkholderia glumae LMG 2196 = ATCC 33617]PNL01313.1 hypothetical protein CEQ24_020070 [Burkholderia glumae]QPQ93234.1 hypothetical protein I6H06_13215 [Burkholderia glumae]QQM91563.1 hypothetical protein I6G78_04535 [Burkholderia glumae]
MATTLILGDFEFQDFEVPEVIGFGGDQRLSIKKMLGGVRDVQALGTDPRPIEWAGQFFPTQDGQTALDRALTLKQMMDAAQPLYLSWDEIYLQVFIRSFDPDYRFARIPYRISCEVVADLTAPVYEAGEPDADDLIDGDLDSANSLTEGIGDSTLSGLMDTVSSAVGSVSTFVGAAQSTVASVLQPLNAAAQRVSSLIASTDSVLASVGVPAGVLPSVPLLSNISVFTSQLGACGQQTQLLQLSGLLGRIKTNLGLVNSSVRTTTVPGGNLFDIASKEYGDPTAWTLIANANNLTDPTLAGISTLIIPPYVASASGGVLSS